MAEDQAWRDCQRALAAEVTRVTALLRSLPAEPPTEPALGDWSLLEVAAHLSHVWLAIPGLARADLAEFDALVPDRGTGASVARDVDQLGTVTLRAVAADPERDPTTLADRIETRAQAYLADCASQDPGQLRPWVISGITVPPPVFTAHLLGETVVHGWDIARAAGRAWRIESAHAALVISEFLMAVMRRGGRTVFPNPDQLAAAQGRYQLDIRGHNSVRLVLDDAGARLDPELGRAPDCRISVDPAGFLLMFFGRRGTLATVARGGLLTWGRKPWLALRLQAALPRP